MINLINVEEPLQNALELIGQYCKHNDCKTCGLKINDDICLTDKDPDVWWMYLNVHRPQTMIYPQVDGITPSVIEPQTYITEDRDTQILDAWQVHHRNTTSVGTEPQTERSNTL